MQMQIGKYEIGATEVSVALMIMFAMAAMFFLGYRYAYGKAIIYANEQIEEKIEEFKVENNLIMPDVVLGNIPPINWSDKDGR